MKKRYWGRHVRARGCICVTAGELSKKMIKEYLVHHFERDPNDGFDIEVNSTGCVILSLLADFQAA